MPTRVAKTKATDTAIPVEFPVVAVNNQVVVANTFPTPAEILSLSHEDQIIVDEEVEIILKKILVKIKATYNGAEFCEHDALSAQLSPKISTAVLVKVREILQNSNWKITYTKLRSGSNPNTFNYWVSDYQKALEAEALKQAKDKSRKKLKLTLFITLPLLLAIAGAVAFHFFGG